MQQIKLPGVIILYFTSAVVAEEMVQRRNSIRKVSIADAVDHIKMFPGMEMIEAQPILCRIR